MARSEKTSWSRIETAVRGCRTRKKMARNQEWFAHKRNKQTMNSEFLTIKWSTITDHKLSYNILIWCLSFRVFRVAVRPPRWRAIRAEWPNEWATANQPAIVCYHANHVLTAPSTASDVADEWKMMNGWVTPAGHPNEIFLFYDTWSRAIRMAGIVCLGARCLSIAWIITFIQSRSVCARARTQEHMTTARPRLSRLWLIRKNWKQ